MVPGRLPILANRNKHVECLVRPTSRIPPDRRGCTIFRYVDRWVSAGDTRRAREMMSTPIRVVRTYHQSTKHHLRAFAPGPAYLDWATQPDPFRRFSGAEMVPLPLVDGCGRCTYDALYGVDRRSASRLSESSLGLLLELSLGLSAWKAAGGARWALRNNPSSGNLHPTEGYLLLWRAVSEVLVPGLYHYVPEMHALERRAFLPQAAANRLDEAHVDGYGAIGLSSIIWREEWKYGARAFRYCQHDVGHALAAFRLAAGVLGWRLRMDDAPADETVSALLGIDRDADFSNAETEHPDLLAVFGPAPTPRGRVPWDESATALEGWRGHANRLSTAHVAWPQIANVLPAVHKSDTPAAVVGLSSQGAGAPAATGAGDACVLIRQRRSAQRMDGHSAMRRADFERALRRTLPASDRAPFDALPFEPAVSLLLFVHRVDDLEPGLYLLDRDHGRFPDLKNACTSPQFDWARVDDSTLPLFRLQAPLDVEMLASGVSCHQDIAAQGAFAVAMLGDLGGVLASDGGWGYRRLHWECGMIGQVLYLEAESVGLRGTGIGCFFDDEVHRLLGIETTAEARWQTLYHFTVGGAVEDLRLRSEPPYAHLDRTEMRDGNTFQLSRVTSGAAPSGMRQAEPGHRREAAC